MPCFETTLVHQDVLDICSVGDTLFAAIGGWIYVYKGKCFQSRHNIFQGQKIHNLKLESSNDSLIVLGGKNWAQCSITDNSSIEIQSVTKINDWILDAEETTEASIILVTAHNEAQIWDKGRIQLTGAVSPSERCILYSAKIHVINEKVFILAGTVFSQVLVWELSNQSILYRLEGHKGVIFSICISISRNHPVTICTTSDDRSIRLYNGENFEKGCLQEQPPLYGHTARVWKALATFDHILTIGEDSLLCVWSYDGELISKTELHHGAGIRSITCRSESFLTGGSDGGIFHVLPDSIFNQPESSIIEMNFLEKEIPRKVAYFGKWGMVCLTSKRLLFRTDHGPFKEITDGQVLFPKCTDMATADGIFIGLTTVTGCILIYRILEDQIKFEMFTENLSCESLRWCDHFLMVGIKGGSIKLFETATTASTPIDVFQLPKCKDQSFTCFLRIETKTVIGDRNGNLHVYLDGMENPVQTLKNLHGHLGTFDIFYHSSDDTLLTIGAGGWVKQLRFLNDQLNIVKSFAVPMESSVKIIDSGYSPIVAGFHGTFLKLWDMDKQLLIASFQCGGGHRSFHFRNNRSFHTLNFLFIKDKKLYQVQFNLKFGEELRSSFHSKMINCLANLGEECVVSGGDDNILRITKFGGFDVEPIHRLQQHISSIRAIRVIPRKSDKKLIISVGGREQICITEYCCKTRDCRELLSHVQSGSPAEGRFMCLDVLKQTDQHVQLAVGCSDCTIRIINWDESRGLAPVGVIKYTNCVLNVRCMMDFVVSFATDGKAVFWDVKKTIIPDAPTFCLQLHQSGINSALISKKSENEFYFVTGGDDNLLSVLHLRLTAERIWEMVSRWTSAASHACQITGLILHDRWLISTSIDQRVVLHMLSVKDRGVEAEIIEDALVTVPDSHGLALLEADAFHAKVCVYGKGIENIQIKFKNN